MPRPNPDQATVGRYLLSRNLAGLFAQPGLQRRIADLWELEMQRDGLQPWAHKSIMRALDRMAGTEPTADGTPRPPKFASPDQLFMLSRSFRAAGAEWSWQPIWYFLGAQLRALVECIATTDLTVLSPADLGYLVENLEETIRGDAAARGRWSSIPNGAFHSPAIAAARFPTNPSADLAIAYALSNHYEIGYPAQCAAVLEYLLRWVEGI